jgi:hypothetical protein
MRGWKTYLAGSMSILFGISQLIISNGASVNESIAYILGGLAAVGIGHKVDKASSGDWGTKPPTS